MNNNLLIHILAIPLGILFIFIYCFLIINIIGIPMSLIDDIKNSNLTDPTFNIMNLFLSKRIKKNKESVKHYGVKLFYEEKELQKDTDYFINWIDGKKFHIKIIACIPDKIYEEYCESYKVFISLFDNYLSGADYTVTIYDRENIYVNLKK